MTRKNDKASSVSEELIVTGRDRGIRNSSSDDEGGETVADLPGGVGVSGTLHPLDSLNKGIPGKPSDRMLERIAVLSNIYI